MTKTQRQHRIAQILSTSTVTSQAQLVTLLCTDGIRLAAERKTSGVLLDLRPTRSSSR